MQHYIPRFGLAQCAAGENWFSPLSLRSAARSYYNQHSDLDLWILFSKPRNARVRLGDILLPLPCCLIAVRAEQWRLCYWRLYVHYGSVRVAHSGFHSTAYVCTSDTCGQDLGQSLDSASPTIQVQNKGKKHKRHNRHIELFTHFTHCTLVQLQRFT